MKFDIVTALPLFAWRERDCVENRGRRGRLIARYSFVSFFRGEGDNRWDFTLCRNFTGKMFSYANVPLFKYLVPFFA